MSYPSTGYRFLHVAFNFHSGPTKVTQLIPLFNEAKSWYRYAPNCWILWTTGTPEAWYKYVAPHVGKDDYVLIVEINLQNRFGSLPQGAWDWIKERAPK